MKYVSVRYANGDEGRFGPFTNIDLLESCLINLASRPDVVWALLSVPNPEVKEQL